MIVREDLPPTPDWVGAAHVCANACPWCEPVEPDESHIHRGTE